MATSGTTTFSVNRDDIISASLRLLGVLELGAVPDPTTVHSASLVLNMMLKDWMTDGIKLWTVDDICMDLWEGQTSYKIGPNKQNCDVVTDKPLRMLDGFIRNNQVTPAIDIPMTVISQQEYDALGSKYSTGMVNSIFYQPFVDYGILRVFLTPDTNTANNYTLHLTVQRPIYDMTQASDTFDFPSEWFQSLRWGLASELAADYGLSDQRAGLIIARAEQYKQRLMAWDVENASTFFQPDGRMYNPRFL